MPRPPFFPSPSPLCARETAFTKFSSALEQYIDDYDKAARGEHHDGIGQGTRTAFGGYLLQNHMMSFILDRHHIYII